MAAAPPRTRRARGARVPRPRAGDRRVWRAAAVAGAVWLVAVAVYVLVPREVYTGTNSVGPRTPVAELAAGDELCVPGQQLPAGTGRLHFWAGTPAGAAPAELTVRIRSGGRTLTGTAPASALPADGALDVALPTATRTAPAEVCFLAAGGAAWIGGAQNIPYGDVPAELNGRPLEARIGLWYRPPAGEKTSLLSAFGDMAQRAALFRPGWVGAWTYWVLIWLVVPAISLAGVALLARSAAGVPARVPRGPAVLGLAFVAAATFALCTPLFHAPDESEHFAAAQHLAETGEAVERAPGGSAAYSDEQALALAAVRHETTIASAASRPPWIAEREDAWRGWVRDERPRRDDGGGYAIATASHTPLYYALLAPAYLAARDGGVPAELTAMRLVSALLGAVAALCAFLVVRELLPRHEWAAVMAGLVVAFQPMYGFISGAVNNDAGVNAAAAVLIYLLVRALRRGLTLRLALAVGVMFALTPLLKGTGYALWPLAALALAAAAWRSRAVRPFAAAVAAALVVVVGWRVLGGVFDAAAVAGAGAGGGGAAGGAPPTGVWAFDHPVGALKYVASLFVPGIVDDPIYPNAMPVFTIYVIRGWASFGWYAVQFPDWVYVPVGLALIGAAALAVAALRRARRDARRIGLEIALLALLPLAVFAAVELFYATESDRPFGIAEQGRYLFPAIVALAAGAVAAAFGLGRRHAVALGTAIVVSVMGFAFLGRLLELSGFYA